VSSAPVTMAKVFIRLVNREQAPASYTSQGYQSIISDRDKGVNCSFQIIG
jgi:uncharacterized protein (DUF1330 family)